MTRKKVILSTIFLLVLGLTGLRAQLQLNVTEKAGTVSSFALSSIGKLSFSEGNLLVNKTSGITSTFGLSNIQKLTFAPSTVGVKNIASKGSSSISLYPNPVIDELQLSYESIQAKTLQVEIIDLQGRVLHREVISNQNGSNHAIIPLSQLGKGLYLCRMQYGDKSETIKFLKN